jgi:hypothetical protein
VVGEPLANRARNTLGRSRAEAAIVETRDDIEGALRKLDEGERSILLLPDRTQRELLLYPLRRWRSELDSRLPAEPCDPL